MKFKLPENIEQLLPNLENLATFGAVHISEEEHGWLASIGVVCRNKNDGWSIPTISWIENTLPSRDSKDLLRKTIIRDPRYRVHLDISLASVLHTIGVSERWQRIEELIFGPFLNFTPRFIQLIEWQLSVTGKGLAQILESDWEGLNKKMCQPNNNIFATWDNDLWGENRSPSTMFPLLTELYLPVLNVPIFCNSDDQTLSEDSLDLLIQIENAAKNKESVILPESKRKIADVLQQNGFPIRISSKNEKFLSICLIGCVSHSCDVDVSYKDYPTEPVSHGVAEKVRHFCTTNMESVFENNSSDFWSLIDADVSFYVFLCIEDKSEKWPDEESEYNPPWFNLPDKKSLMDVGKPRSLSPTTDEKLLILCNHTLFGFIIQIFLLEALDRELGEETLILAPPIHYRSDNLEAETHIFYQPRASRGPEGKLIRQPSFDIGQIDETFSMLGRRLCIKGICFPYLNETIGPWSFATKLLRDAGVIVGYHDRWTIASHVLDRLHGGGLMTKVIRRGRNFREKIHRELLNIWEMQKTEKKQEKEIG